MAIFFIIFKVLWLSGFILIIDKFMICYTGRVKEKLIILNKLILIGIKGWLIIKLGYFLYQIWYVWGSGL